MGFVRADFAQTILVAALAVVSLFDTTLRLPHVLGTIPRTDVGYPGVRPRIRCGKNKAWGRVERIGSGV